MEAGDEERVEQRVLGRHTQRPPVEPRALPPLGGERLRDRRLDRVGDAEVAAVDYVAGGEGLGGARESIAVLAGWGLAGLAIAVRMFRWEPREA